MHAKVTIVLFDAQQRLFAAMSSVAVNLTTPLQSLCHLQMGRLILDQPVSYRSLGVKLFQLHC